MDKDRIIRLRDQFVAALVAAGMSSKRIVVDVEESSDVSSVVIGWRVELYCDDTYVSEDKNDQRDTSDIFLVANFNIRNGVNVAFWPFATVNDDNKFMFGYIERNDPLADEVKNYVLETKMIKRYRAEANPNVADIWVNLNQIVPKHVQYETSINKFVLELVEFAEFLRQHKQKVIRHTSLEKFKSAVEDV